MQSTKAVGGDLPRPDGRAKVSGAALYVDDLHLEGLYHGATVRSPHGHARIRSIDADAARAADPDIFVVTARDLPGPNVVHLIKDDQPILADGLVRHMQEPVALVAAPTRERALAAAQRIHIDYEVLPALGSLEEALDRGHGGSDLEAVLHEITIAEGDLDRGFAEADLVVEGVYAMGHQEQMYIEPQGMIAIPLADGGLELVGSMQCPYYVVKALAPAFGLEPRQLRVRQATTGGGFGGKEDYPNILAAHTASLARAAGRPVKVIYDRHEDIVATTKRHPAIVRHRTGVKRDGTLVAIDVDLDFDGGAYLTLSSVVLSRGLLHAAGPYRCPNVRLHGRVLSTHTPPNGAFRGFGAPQTIFAAERHMDRIGRALGIDPLSLRRRNAMKEGDITPTGQVLKESVSAHACLEEVARRTNFSERWAALEAERLARARGEGAPGPWRGIGLSLYWHGAGFTGNGENMLKSRAAVALRHGGRVSILTASTDIGQGTSAAFPQMVAEAMGLSVHLIQMDTPDTSLVPDSGPTVASRTIMIVGDIVARAGAELARRLCEFVAERHALEVEDVHLVGDSFRGPHGVFLEHFAAAGDAWLAERGPLVVEEGYTSHGRFFDEKTYRGDAYPCFAWGADVLELSVDPDTLILTPEKMTVVCDVGRVIHPVLCTGQVEGGTLQAIAWGYLEEMKLDGARFRNDRMTTYLIPTTRDTPAFDVVLMENPYSGGPFGAKGVGELPMDGGAPALVAALENATGISSSILPVTPERLLDDLLRGHTVEGAPVWLTNGLGASAGSGETTR